MLSGSQWDSSGSARRAGLPEVPWALLWALFAVVILNAACSPSVEPVQPATKAAIAALRSQPLELPWAESKATAGCMAGHGFRYPPHEVFQPGGANGVVNTLAGVSGLFTIQEAQQRGYGNRILTAPDPNAPNPVEAEAEYKATLTPDEQQRYDQVLEDADGPQAQVTFADGGIVSASTRGCIAEGRGAVYGSVRSFLKLQYQWQGILGFSEDASRDPVVEEALDTYSSCMKEAGYDVEEPDAALKLAREQFGGTRPVNGPVSDAERAMAVADATCQVRSGIAKAYDNALIRAASAWLNEHEGEIIVLADIQNAALARAARILRSA